ncbi:uncharacterized protein LOC142169669 [Nicotiana tabacum]|uniref:Uncharacterized protein LOC142169669 n=1 Tax=Nicotiana tabacum TaxID=4097 RepID=A0AC58SRR6_TOBAC
MINNVPTMVSMEQNMELCRYPTLEEVKAVIFELNGNSSSGPDGFTGMFYQESWEIISNDIHNILEKFLPEYISPNKSGFVKGRSIFENILLTQEIVIDIRKRGKPANLVIKLDMSKAYERVSWKYLMQKVEDITGFTRGQFPFMYLGCPIFYTRRRKDYYQGLIKKLKDKLHAWKGKLLSSGGKALLITSVLQSMPVYLLSVLDPPQNILKHLHKIFARFFWSTKEEGRSRHWASWQKLCTPKDERGLGFRSLNDVSKELFLNLWWRFRTAKSLWSNYMWNKYYKKEIPTKVQFKQGSHVRKQMLNAREHVEHEILWEMKSDTTNIWHENWIGLGALYQVLPPDFKIEENLQEVAELRQGREWNGTLIDQNFLEDIAEHIKKFHYDSREE